MCSYTQIVGDPLERPIIKGDSSFVGIAMVNVDGYRPREKDSRWYTEHLSVPTNPKHNLRCPATLPANKTYAPTGLHWQVAPATSLMNLDPSGWHHD